MVLLSKSNDFGYECMVLLSKSNDLYDNVWFYLVKPTILCQNSKKTFKHQNKTDDLHENVWCCLVKPMFWCKTTKNLQKTKQNQ